MARAPQIRTKHPDETRSAAVSFDDVLDSGELLTGTPTVTIDPSGPTLSNKRVNTGTIVVDGRSVVAGRGVQFSVAGGTDGERYEITVTCGTDASPSQTVIATLTLDVAA
jgi:hypothetical protein